MRGFLGKKKKTKAKAVAWIFENVNIIKIRLRLNKAGELFKVKRLKCVTLDWILNPKRKKKSKKDFETRGIQLWTSD